jgi:hypothetical protein
VNSRTRWTIGILVALVIGLVVGLIIVIGDDNNDNTGTTTVPIQSVTAPTITQPTTTSQTTTSSTPTQTNGGTPVPPGGSTTPGGTGGL